MRPIDADALKDKVLKWMPSDPCGIAEKERPIETDIAVSLMMEIEDAPTIEPSGDLISRQDAIDSIEYWHGIDVSEAINKTPSADRPKGEWKWTHGGQCSECGFHNTNFDFNFCPNCGADMRGDVM